MNDRVCPIDGAALTPDRYVCRGCTGTLRGLLTDLPGLMTDLDIALTRQSRFTARLGGASTSTQRLTDDERVYAQTAAVTAMPFGYEASEAGYVARMTLLRWVDRITAIRAHRAPETWTEVGDYLANHALRWVAAHPDGPQIVDELTAAIRHARRAIDRPADRRFIGTCGHVEYVDVTTYADPAPVLVIETTCTEQLYAPTDRATIECRRCGTTHDVRTRQDRMLERIRDVLLPAVDIARAVDGLGVDLTADRVRQWKRRGVLAVALDERGNPRADAKGRPLYRVGDVLDVVAGRVACAS